jgi:catechol 2,3-dioxygenase-like lactoylglutathione lyase family enzyme
MIEYIRSLGWFIRFLPAAHLDVTKFYGETLGLPFVRAGTSQAVDFYWAGESIIHELIFEGQSAALPAAEREPSTAALIPIYRVTDLDGLCAILRDKEVELTPITRYAHGRECFLRDPLGSLIGLRQADAGSVLPQDVEARRRAQRGEAFNPGCAPMPKHWQELGWIQRRVADVAATARFYTNVLGLKQVAAHEGRTLLDLGDNSLLELAPGGSVVVPPTNRAELPATFILRIQNIAAFKADMQRHGVRIVHDVIQWARGSLSYVADPEGNLIGVEEKYHPGKYAGHAPFPEDLEAQRRWVEHGAARSAAPRPLAAQL